VIRLFGLRDTLMLKQLEKLSVSLDVRRQVLHPSAVLRAALMGHLSRHHLGPLTWVLEDARRDRDRAGFLQVWPSAGRPDWTLGLISPGLDQDDEVEMIWRHMLSCCIEQAAMRGVQRILARVPEEAVVERVLRNSGYLVITREELFAGTRTYESVAQPKHLGVAGPDDSWHISELYHQVLPRHVQEAEAILSRRSVTQRSALLSSADLSEYVWRDEGRISAYLALSRGSAGYWLEVLVRPEHRADIIPHIKYVLGARTRYRHFPVYCAVPDYQAGVSWLLRALDFESLGREVQMVTHVAQRARARRPVLVPGLEGSEVRTPMGSTRSLCPGQEHCAVCVGLAKAEALCVCRGS
jgi:hypothetical protein